MDLIGFFEIGGSFDSGIQGSETGSLQGAQGFTGESWAGFEGAPREIPFGRLRAGSPPAGESAGVRDDAFF